MRTRLVVPLIVGVVGALMLVAGPASAAPSGTTPVTLEVTGATLDISVPTTAVDLGTVVTSGLPQEVSAALGAVTVTDGRGATTGWTATANGVDFTGPQTISVSAAGLSGYVAPGATVTGTAAVAGTDLTQLYPPAAVQTATGVVGNNSATWNPTISITVPANALAGTYSSTITHSVS